MEPSLPSGSMVLVNRIYYFLGSPKTGDIVAVKDPRDGKILIKRVNKLSGNKVFVLGDNEKQSTDSRKFGMIEISSIIGKVVYH